MPNHKTVELMNPTYKDICDIDEGIIDLISVIWRVGYSTYNSCEDNNGEIWIEFDLEEFKSLCQIAHTFNLDHGDKYEYDTLSNFMINDCDKTINILDDGYVIEEKNEYLPGRNTWFTASIRFDKSQKDKFIKLWKQTFKYHSW